MDRVSRKLCFSNLKEEGAVQVYVFNICSALPCCQTATSFGAMFSPPSNFCITAQRRNLATYSLKEMAVWRHVKRWKNVLIGGPSFRWQKHISLLTLPTLLSVCPTLLTRWPPCTASNTLTVDKYLTQPHFKNPDLSHRGRRKETQTHLYTWQRPECLAVGMDLHVILLQL